MKPNVEGQERRKEMSKKIIAVCVAVCFFLVGVAAYSIGKVNLNGWGTPVSAEAAMMAYAYLKGQKSSQAVKVEIRHNRLFIVGSDGTETPAKDGIYELTDRRKISVRNGLAIIDVN